MLTHPHLMTRIEQYSFDNPILSKPDFGFIDRLCIETGWSKVFAQGAIAEYRRFVYLAVTGDRPVTPSREVDAVWHLHLTYTRSYWERLRAILPRDLHHEPTPGGRDAAAIYRAQYAATKARYTAEFGKAPPETYWPPEEERFQSDMRRMRGLSRDLDRPAHPRLAVAGIAAMAALVAAPAFAADGLSGETLTAFMIGAGMFMLLGGVTVLSRIGSASSPNKKKKDQGDGGSVYYGGDGGSSSSGKGGKGDGKDGGEGGEAGGEGSGGEGGGDGGGDGGGGGCGGGCGS